jgi:GDPmannose 4,6-dehydratase
MYLILQQDKAEDYVIATGITTTVRDFIKMSFAHCGVEVKFEGSGENEKGIVVSCSNKNYTLKAGAEVVAVDKRYFRPAEVEMLIGDPTKAKKQLGWQPKYNLSALVNEMMDADLELFNKKLTLKNSGYTVNRQHE